jgi:hypothetical protein
MNKWLSFGLLLLCLVGCDDGGYGALGLVEVTGRVALDGSPLPNAKVRFEDDNGAGSEGTTDADGQYRLMYDSEHPGCTPGQKIVRITLANVNEEGADPDAAAGGEGGQVAEALPAIYNRQSTLQADVSPANRNFDFELKSKP